MHLLNASKKKILGNIVQKDVQGSVKVVTLGTSKSWEFIGLILIELPLRSWSSLLNAFFFFNTHIFSRFIFLSPNIQSWIFTEQSGLGSTTAKWESTMTSKGEVLNHSTSVCPNAPHFTSMHASSAHCIQVARESMSACMGSAGKELVNLELTIERVRLRLHHAMNTTAWPRLPCRKDLHQRVWCAAPG